jgi:hypothetical protein
MRAESAASLTTRGRMSVWAGLQEKTSKASECIGGSSRALTAWPDVMRQMQTCARGAAQDEPTTGQLGGEQPPCLAETRREKLRP